MAHNPPDDSAIEVKKTLFWQSPRIGCRLNAHIFGYSSVKGGRLIGALEETDFASADSTLGVAHTSARLIHSDDDGETWQQAAHFSTARQTSDGLVHEFIQSAHLDVQSDVCVLFYLRRWVTRVALVACPPVSDMYLRR
jgi:hypothetical protein